MEIFITKIRYNNRKPIMREERKEPFDINAAYPFSLAPEDFPTSLKHPDGPGPKPRIGPYINLSMPTEYAINTARHIHRNTILGIPHKITTTTKTTLKAAAIILLSLEPNSKVYFDTRISYYLAGKIARLIKPKTYLMLHPKTPTNVAQAILKNLTDGTYLLIHEDTPKELITLINKRLQHRATPNNHIRSREDPKNTQHQKTCQRRRFNTQEHLQGKSNDHICPQVAQYHPHPNTPQFVPQLFQQKNQSCSPSYEPAPGQQKHDH